MNVKTKSSKQRKLGKHELEIYMEDLERCFSLLNTEDQKKREFVDYFLAKLQLYDIDGSRIQIEEMDMKTLKFFLFSVVLEYETWLLDKNKV